MGMFRFGGWEFIILGAICLLVFIPIIITIIVVAITSNQKNASSKANCPYCSQTIITKDTYCRACGRPLTPRDHYPSQERLP
jgi:hypothetical protein